MPYKDPSRQREAVRAWKRAHPEKVRAYQRAELLKRSIAQRTFPRPSSVAHHALTEQDLTQILASVLLASPHTIDPGLPARVEETRFSNECTRSEPLGAHGGV